MVKIWVVPAGTAASALVSTSQYSASVPTGYIAGEIKSYSKGGGELEVESEPLFGGYADVQSPVSQHEISFDIVPSIDRAGLWESMVYGEDSATGVLTGSKRAATDRAVFIESKTTNKAAGWAFNNVFVTSLENEHDSEENMTQTMELKFAPENSSGVSNIIFNSTARDSSFTEIGDLPAWTSLDNN